MRQAVLTIIFALLLTLPALAAEGDYGASSLGGAVPDSAREILGGAEVKDALDPSSLLGKIADAAQTLMGSLWKNALSSAGKLLVICLVCGAASSLTDKSVEHYVNLGGVLAVAVIAVGDAGVFIGKASAALDDAYAFSKALLPCLTMSASAAGAVTSASAKYAATALFTDIAISAARSVVLPLVYAYIAACAASAALGNDALSAAAKLLKWLCGTVTTLVVTVFTAYLSLTGAVTGASDAAATKAAKTVISSALPVVGGVISDAASSVVAGAGLMRGAIGAFGFVVVAAVCLTPFLSLGLQYLMYKAAGAIGGSIAPKEIGGLISDIGGAFALVLGVIGAVAIMLFISILSFIKAAGI